MYSPQERPGGPVPSYTAGLERYSPLFLIMDLIVAAALAFYRIRAYTLLGGISPDLVSGDGFGGYITTALSSDALSLALIATVIAGAWLLAPVIRTAAAVLSLLAVLSYSTFTVFMTDFLRVYQTAFGKSYVGGEHFTGLREMLLSVSVELSPASWAAAGAALLACSSVLALGKRIRVGVRPAFRALRIICLAAVVTLAACLLSSTLWRNGRLLSAARIRGMELGGNPVSALVFGPGRETFMPNVTGKAVPAAYDTDSIEKRGIRRPIPAVHKGRYNVILWFCESTSWRCYDLVYDGQQVLPAMHALARNGILLKNHYANYPLSANTMYSVLSSRYSMYGKAMIFKDYHDVDVDTLPEVLARNGYATGFIHTGDLLYASRNRFLANRSIGTFLLYKDLVKDARYRRKVGWGADERSMIRPAVDWIRAQSSPWLLMMAPVNPHHPYAIPDDVERIADPGEAGIGARETTWRNYPNSLHYADAAMGELIRTLEREGCMKNTVLVIVADHGEAFYQHPGNYNHPLFIYEENVHVPALFSSASLFPRGVVMESVTRHVDIMPSILDLLGIQDGTRRDGESIFSPSREKMAVFHTSWTDEYMGVRDGRWKYILRMKDSREELYDLEADPWEKTDVAALNPAIVSRYREVSEDMVAYLLAQYKSVKRKR
jgi:hypothetical protein